MKKFITLVIVLLSLTLAGCSLPIKENKDSDLGRRELPVLDDETTPANSSNSNLKISAYTGENLENNQIGQTPFMAIIENSTASRPQSGLASADIIFETMAEGGIPRFIALYQKESPQKIGPIRSVRPYFIDIAKEYALPFAHCGGSEEALNEIKSDSSIMSINEISNGSYFYRDKNKKSPHNLFTSANNIRKFIKDKGLKTSIISNLNFDEKTFQDTSLEKVTNIDIKLNSNYQTSYSYRNGKYQKSMDGKLATDGDTQSPLTFKNIVIQTTNIKLQKDNLHIDVDLVGKGDALVFSQGKMKKVTWQKKDKTSPTQLLDSEGNKVALSQGNTIWHIIDKSAKLDFK
jgi:hypothetical protein